MSNDNDAEDVCAGCRASPLDLSLVLACNHRLCVNCAVRQLRWPQGGDPSASCPDCGGVTEVERSAAQQLRDEGRPRVPAVGGGGEGGGHAAGPVVPPLSWVSSHHREAPSSLSRDSHKESFSGPRWDGRDAPSVRENQGRPASASREPSPLGGSQGHGQGLCGQCQVRPAEVDCWQCSEQFCGHCAASMHQAGRMKDHKLTQLRGGGGGGGGDGGRRVVPPPVPPEFPKHDGDAGQTGCAAVVAGTSPRLLHRTFICCPVHPEEPLQFYCLDCESECICAECAVHGSHRGHDVLNVRLAYQKHSGSIVELLESTRARYDEQVRVMDEAEMLKRDLDSIINRGRYGLQEAFERVRASLAQKELLLVAGADECERLASQALVRRVSPAEERAAALHEAQKMLAKLNTAGDEVLALNAYASAKQRVEELMDPLDGVDGGGLAHILDTLRSHVRGTLELQVGDVSALSTHVHSIRLAGASASQG